VYVYPYFLVIPSFPIHPYILTFRWILFQIPPSYLLKVDFS
jgi:hypothetical protein